MSSALAQQLALMFCEAVIAASVLLLLFRVRAMFGFVPIYITAAIYYQLANLLAGTVYVRIAEDLMVSPGSVVLFPAILVAVLFVYIRGDANEARKFIYGLLAGDLVVAALGMLIAQHFSSPLLVNPHDLNAALFTQQPRIIVVGTLALFADTVLIILVYELIARYVGYLVIRIGLSLLLVLAFDTMFFVTGSFLESPAYGSILVSGLVGKSVTGALYAVLLTVYIRRFDVVVGQRIAGTRRDLVGLFEALTYRERYEVLRAQMTRDALTGIYNRAFFDDSCEALIARSRRTNSPLTLMMIDLDHFKAINDRYGHRVGDQVLRASAAAIATRCRASDLVCRYGGEELAVLLPDTALAPAVGLAERILLELPSAVAAQLPSGIELHVTATIGVASFPHEAGSMEELFQLADQRLYEGKRTGRNRVVPGHGSIPVGDWAVGEGSR